MNNRFLEKLFSQFEAKKTLLCVGLDPDITKIDSRCYSKDIEGIRKFLFDVIDATKDYVISYKPNMAFFEYFGWEGLKVLKEVIEYIPDDIPVIVDGKRGDIGNTSKKYAYSLFEYFNADAITIAPYMGSDSIEPFLEYRDRFVFVLVLTSNKGSDDFEKKRLDNNRFLYEEVFERVKEYNSIYKNTGAVIGATKPDQLLSLREEGKDIIFLVPGVGAQGGDLEKSVLSTNLENKGLSIINSSRGILYPQAEGGDLLLEIKNRAKSLSEKIRNILKKGE